VRQWCGTNAAVNAAVDWIEQISFIFLKEENEWRKKCFVLHQMDMFSLL